MITFVKTCGIKQHLYHISEKHLSVDVALRLQTKEWAAMEAEVPRTVLN